MLLFVARDPRCKLGRVGSVARRFLGSGSGACVRSSFCLAAGGNNRAGVILIVGGSVLAIAVFVIAW